MFRLMSVFAIVPVSVLLAISYFVMFVNRKTDSRGLKAFGFVVSFILWIAAAVIFLGGSYMAVTGRHPMLECMTRML